MRGSSSGFATSNNEAQKAGCSVTDIPEFAGRRDAQNESSPYVYIICIYIYIWYNEQIPERSAIGGPTKDASGVETKSIPKHIKIMQKCAVAKMRKRTTIHVFLKCRRRGNA